MTLRLDYWSVAPQTTETLLSVNKSLDDSELLYADDIRRHLTAPGRTP